ncbi:GtrA family protein [Actinomyces sp. oral taxon 897]|uniref:GtrA family protein n=1 Tax=Actinomyces sp. oral taxon 897 TaxID=2081702 RepID=UPI0020C4724A|nr:GtrA family protein [Actinomyces sp. oral taxon 897]
MPDNTPDASRSRSRAPEAFLGLMTVLHRLVPAPLRPRVPLTFVGYVLINGSAFVLDIVCLSVFYNHLHWVYQVSVTMGYAVAGVYSLLLNRWLNFQVSGHLALQGSRYAVGLVSQYVIFILGLSSVLHLAGVNAELARVVSACCEGIYLYVLMRLWVFKGASEPASQPATC